MKEKVIQTYTDLVSRYEYEDENSNLYNNDYERPAMVKLLPQNLSGLKILDAGCAAGWYTAYILARGGEPTAIDVTPQMIEATKRRTRGQAHVFLADLTDPLPFHNESFDIILSSLTLHYLEDWATVFKEFHRILKSGGVFMFSTHHPFMDVGLSQTKDYFQKELLTDHWKLEDRAVEVLYYRRSLQEIIRVTGQSFQIEELIEPQPIENLKHKNKKAYDYLMHNPHFLIIKASKPQVNRLD